MDIGAWRAIVHGVAKSWTLLTRHFGECKVLNSCFQFLVEAAIYIVYISSLRIRNVK